MVGSGDGVDSKVDEIVTVIVDGGKRRRMW